MLIPTASVYISIPWVIVIVALFVIYILYLHIKIKARKQGKGIAEYLTKDYATGAEKYQSASEVIDISQSKHRDKIYLPEVLNFIFKNGDQLIIYIHYTYRPQDAESILNNGFHYVDSFYKTATLIVNDRVDFVYKHNLYKRYGKYAIIIAISQSLYNHYLQGISQLGNPDLCVEHLFTEKIPEPDETGEPVYTCPAQFIRGFVNYESGEIVQNPLFNPSYDSPAFLKNLKSYKEFNP